MVSRKFCKSSGSLAGGEKGDKDAGLFLPVVEVCGVMRYTRLQGCVYAVYNEYTKKFKGVAVRRSTDYKTCGIEDLIKSIDASKDKR